MNEINKYIRRQVTAKRQSPAFHLFRGLNFPLLLQFLGSLLLLQLHLTSLTVHVFGLGMEVVRNLLEGEVCLTRH